MTDLQINTFIFTSLAACRKICSPPCDYRFGIMYTCVPPKYMWLILAGIALLLFLGIGIPIIQCSVKACRKGNIKK